jgi:hypothetical protein
MGVRGVAWVNVALHAAGLAAAALAMRAGTPLVELPSRMAWLAGAPPGWWGGWAVWMACALALGAFFVALAEHLPPAIARAAVALAAAGVAIDLLCDVTQAAVLPLAARGASPLFLVVERLAGVGGALVANGLYTLAAGVVTLALRGPVERALGAGVVAAGALMALGGAIDSARLVELSVGPTIVLYCGWTLAVARAVE